MPTEPDEPAVRPAGDAPGREPRRVVVVPGGPVLIEGPVEIVVGDEEPVVYDRFVVALCACRRSHRYPICDTSHRQRVRGAAEG